MDESENNQIKQSKGSEGSDDKEKRGERRGDGTEKKQIIKEDNKARARNTP